MKRAEIIDAYRKKKADGLQEPTARGVLKRLWKTAEYERLKLYGWDPVVISESPPIIGFMRAYHGKKMLRIYKRFTTEDIEL